MQEDIIVPEPSMIESTVIQNECANNNDGWIDLSVSPGDSLIQNYLWSNGETTQDIYDLAAGSYSVIITDTICVDTLYFDVENITNRLIGDSLDASGNITAEDTYEIELNNNNNGCVGNMTLYIESPNDSFSLQGYSGIIFGEYDEFESCDEDWCLSTSGMVDDFSLINVTFTNSGNYEFTFFIMLY